MAKNVVIANHHLIHLLRTSIDQRRLYSFETALTSDHKLEAYAPPPMSAMLPALRRNFTPSETPSHARPPPPPALPASRAHP